MNYALFSDVSLNPKRKLGMGAYLILPNSFLKIKPKQIEDVKIINKMVFRKFEDTSSTKLELQTALWAIEECQNRLSVDDLTLYTDSQCITGLIKRRKKLEMNNYISGKTIIIGFQIFKILTI